MSNTPKNQFTKEAANYWFAYNGDLLWRNCSKKRLVGRVAGGMDEEGYRTLKMNKRHYRVHNVVWNIHHGAIPPGLSVDHINRVRDDNRIENLRLATPSGQATNVTRPEIAPLRKDNTSGYPGITRHRDGGWIVRASKNGVRRYLGYFQVLEAAIQAKEKATNTKRDDWKWGRAAK